MVLVYVTLGSEQKDGVLRGAAEHVSEPHQSPAESDSTGGSGIRRPAADTRRSDSTTEPEQLNQSGRPGPLVFAGMGFRGDPSSWASSRYEG